MALLRAIVGNTILNRLENNTKRVREQSNNGRKKIRLCLPYANGKGDQLSRNLMRKLNRCFNEKVRF